MRRALWFVVVALLAVGAPPHSGGDSTGAVSGAGGGRLSGGRGGRVGGVLRIGVSPLGTLDPAQARSVEQVMVADQLFDSLTAYDPVTLEPVSSLAASWEATPDQRQWTFRLRKGAVFANGRKVTALDVKYSLERVARRGSGSPGAGLLESVAGFGPYRNGGPDLAGVTAPSADVVHIALDEPVSVLASVLASPVLSVVAKESVQVASPARLAESPVGSGPFRVARRRGPVVELQPSPGSHVKLAGIDLVQFEDVRTAYDAFRNGDVDWARVPPEEVDDAAQRYGRGAFRPYMAELFYGFNLKSPKLADARFREALVRGIDRRAVVAAVYHGTVETAGGVVLDGLPGFRPDGCPKCVHDPALARRLVAEAFPPSTGGPPEVTIDFDADPTQEAMAKAVQASLAEVGIRTSLRATAPEAYDRLVLSGEQEVFRLGWIAAYPSPDAVLSPLFRSASPDNLMAYANAVVDDVLSAARAEADPMRRTALYQKAERVIMDDVPVVPIAQLQLQSVVARRVRGLVMTSLGTFDAAVVTVGDR